MDDKPDRAIRQWLDDKVDEVGQDVPDDLPLLDQADSVRSAIGADGDLYLGTNQHIVRIDRRQEVGVEGYGVSTYNESARPDEPIVETACARTNYELKGRFEIAYKQGVEVIVRNVCGPLDVGQKYGVGTMAPGHSHIVPNSNTGKSFWVRHCFDNMNPPVSGGLFSIKGERYIFRADSIAPLATAAGLEADKIRALESKRTARTI